MPRKKRNDMVRTEVGVPQSVYDVLVDQSHKMGLTVADVQRLALHQFVTQVARDSLVLKGDSGVRPKV